MSIVAVTDTQRLFLDYGTQQINGVAIPVDMIVGGIVYAYGAHPMPWRVHRIYRTDSGCCWDIADNNDSVFSHISFETGSILANILNEDGTYGGCVKTREINRNGENVGFMDVFINTVTNDVVLERNSLVFNPCCCVVLQAPKNTTSPTELTTIKLPEGYDLVPDTTQTETIYHAIKSVISEADRDTGPLKSLTISVGTTSATISGEHVVITPGCVLDSSGAVVSSGYNGNAVRVVVSNDNTILIGNRGGISSALQ